SRK
ncbi:hypothetical protein BVZ77_00717B, partial [Haemophilus influenzae]